MDRAPAVDYNNPGVYTPPKARAAGRPHEVGWLDKIQALADDEFKFGASVEPGTIIYEE